MPLIVVSDWNNAALSTPTLPAGSLKPLTGQPEGNPIWKSNNPELIDGSGWLMQNERTDARRGGSSHPLSGLFNIYLFHINRSSTGRTLHVLVKNPNATAITINGRGSMLTNDTHPLGGRGTGQSFHVSNNWLLDTNLASFNKTLNAGDTVEIDQVKLKPKTMVDGRFEVNASAGVFVYTVVTSTGNLTDAVNASQGSPAAGDIREPGPGRFGREAGICNSSIWAGMTEIDVPAQPAHIGLCLNTNSPQEQTSTHTMRLSDSALRTFGNYGHKYDVTLKLNNHSSTTRKVRLSFASAATASMTQSYNGSVLVNGTPKNIFTKPTHPVDELDTATINPSGSFNFNIKFFVPGLISMPQQLILESI